MQVIPHLWLALLQAIPFLVAFLALWLILFKPLLEYMEQRHQVRKAAEDEAAQLTGKIESKLAELDKKLSEAHSEVAAQRAEHRAAAAQAEASILDAARTEAEGKVSDGLARVSAARQQASDSLKGMTASLSSDIATAVLGREVQA